MLLVVCTGNVGSSGRSDDMIWLACLCCSAAITLLVSWVSKPLWNTTHYFSLSNTLFIAEVGEAHQSFQCIVLLLFFSFFGNQWSNIKITWPTHCSSDCIRNAWMLGISVWESLCFWNLVLPLNAKSFSWDRWYGKWFDRQFMFYSQRTVWWELWPSTAWSHLSREGLWIIIIWQLYIDMLARVQDRRSEPFCHHRVRPRYWHWYQMLMTQFSTPRGFKQKPRHRKTT